MHYMRSYILFFLSFYISWLAIASQPRTYYRDIKNIDINTLNTHIKRGTHETISLPDGYNLLHLAAVLNATNQAYAIMNSTKSDINQHTNAKGFTPLFVACHEDNAAMALVLLSCGADHRIANKQGVTPLIRAILNENITIITLLLAHHADVDQKDTINDNTPLHAAIWTGNSKIVDQLLYHKASPNLALQYCFTPLIAATQMEVDSKKEKAHCLKIVQALLNAKANHAVAYLEDQDTALHVAVGNTNREVVFLLLKAGADPNVLNTELQTPLHIALQNIENATSNPENLTNVEKLCSIVRLLLLHGAQLSKKQLKGITLNNYLMLGIITGTSELVKFSLEAGANPNHRTIFNDTPLHILAQKTKNKQSSIIALLLLAHGADLKLVNASQCNALDILLQNAYKYQNACKNSNKSKT